MDEYGYCTTMAACIGDMATVPDCSPMVGMHGLRILVSFKEKAAMTVPAHDNIDLCFAVLACRYFILMIATHRMGVEDKDSRTTPHLFRPARSVSALARQEAIPVLASHRGRQCTLYQSLTVMCMAMPVSLVCTVFPILRSLGRTLQRNRSIACTH